MRSGSSRLPTTPLRPRLVPGRLPWHRTGAVTLLLVGILMAAGCQGGFPRSPRSPARETSAATEGASVSVVTTASPRVTHSGHSPYGNTVEVTLAHLYSSSGGVVVAYMCDARRRCHDRLLSTRDGGQTWTEFTPAGTRRDETFDGLTFLDRVHGWAVRQNCDFGTAAILRTADGGRTWAAAPVDGTTCHAGSGISVDFVDPRNGWMVNQDPTAPYAHLFRTIDGGRTWRSLGNLPALGSVEFASTTRGWLDGNFLEGGLWSTLDGGATWQRVRLSVPPGYQRARAAPSLPTLVGGNLAILPVAGTGAHVRRLPSTRPPITGRRGRFAPSSTSRRFEGRDAGSSHRHPWPFSAPARGGRCPKSRP